MSRDPEVERVASALEANEWYGPAEDLRDGVPVKIVIERVREFAGDQAELDRALPLLEELIA
jgi:hypothetical protein